MGQDQLKHHFLFFLLLRLRLYHQIHKNSQAHLKLSKRFSQGIPVWALLGAFSVLLLLVGRAVLGKLWKLSSVPQPPLQLFSEEAAQCCVKEPWVQLKSVAVMMWAAIQNSVGRATDIPDTGEWTSGELFIAQDGLQQLAWYGTNSLEIRVVTLVINCDSSRKTSPSTSQTMIKVCQPRFPPYGNYSPTALLRTKWCQPELQQVINFGCKK